MQLSGGGGVWRHFSMEQLALTQNGSTASPYVCSSMDVSGFLGPVLLTKVPTSTSVSAPRVHCTLHPILGVNQEGDPSLPYYFVSQTCLHHSALALCIWLYPIWLSESFKARLLCFALFSRFQFQCIWICKSLTLIRQVLNHNSGLLAPKTTFCQHTSRFVNLDK